MKKKIKHKRRYKIYEIKRMLISIKYICKKDFYDIKLYQDCKKEYDKIFKILKNGKYNVRFMEKRVFKLWRFLKDKILVFDKKKYLKRNSKCERCNNKNNIEIHHSSYYENRKCYILCKKCHKLKHKKFIEYLSFPKPTYKRIYNKNLW